MLPERLLVLLAAFCAASAAVIPLSTNITAPYTHPWDPSLRPATDFLPLTTGIAADNSTGNEPSQIHLTIAGPNAISVNWATGKAKTGKGFLQPSDAFGTPSVVKYGQSASNLSMTATGTAQVYSQIYNASYAFWGGNSTLNYTSPNVSTSPNFHFEGIVSVQVLHTVVLPDLTPDTAYYYKVGDGATLGDTLMFHSLKAAGPSYPQRLILLADWGLSHNSSSTLDHAVKSALQSTSPPCILFIADFCYADTWYPNGTVSSPNTAVEGNPNAGSYQPVWDAWQRFVQPLVGQVPMVGGTGNHEEEQEADGTIFKAVQARWPTPYRASASPSYFFYSVNVGPSHNIFLSNYIDYTVGSQQYIWLNADLANINRSQTPWVTVNFHNPWYTTDTSYKEFEQMRVAMEPLTYAAGVDVFFYGHVHAYERSAPVNNYTVDPCGTVHITIGDAGNSEGISFLDNFQDPKLQFEDLNGGCPNVNATQPRPSYLLPLNPNKDPWSWYQRTLTFQADGNSTGVGNPPGYCYKEQPAWSLYRESSFGHGTLDIVNSTHALWSWHANQDSNAVARDHVYIVRNTTACPNKLSSSVKLPAPSASSLSQPVMSASSGG